MTTIFTNGCFDLLHVGHIRLLRYAKSLAPEDGYLIVGLNSDSSVERIKGHFRPITPHEDRAEILRGLRYVDEVLLFHEDTPLKLIEEVRPDILIKGSDWQDKIVGQDFVEGYGGKVVVYPRHAEYSTSEIVNYIKTYKSY